MIKRHPEPDLLVEYTSGTLQLAPCISVTAHLQYCDKCSQAVESLKSLGGSMLETCEKSVVSDNLLDRVLDCIEQEGDIPRAETPRRTQDSLDAFARDLPEYVRDLLPAGALPWRSLTSSLRVAPVSVGEENYELALHRILAGGKAPEHDHRGMEITVVLKGSFSDEDGLYQPGDFIVRQPGDTHRPLAAKNEECICLSVLEAPIRLTGVKRVLNPFLGFSPS
ncbi:MAG: ChrR family anti-sigma-E factor [Proteobacteria bacterium]|nr:ChrR family anti-sigma-E factor [Pseudomonadota bacterium]